MLVFQREDGDLFLGGYVLRVSKWIRVFIIFHLMFLASCQMVTVQEMAYIQSVRTSKTNLQKLYINSFDPKVDTLLYKVSKADFEKRYKISKWVYLEITKIEDIGPTIDAYLVKGGVDELVLNAHGSPFKMKIGNQKLSKSNIKKINLKGSLEPNAKIFLYSCMVGQKSMYQFGEPFVKALGKAFMKNKGTIYASTKLVNYPFEYIHEIGVKTNYRWYEKVAGYILLPIILPIYQYLTWNPWDTNRVREIEI